MRTARGRRILISASTPARALLGVLAVAAWGADGSTEAFVPFVAVTGTALAGIRLLAAAALHGRARERRR